MRKLLLLVLAACGSSSTGPDATVDTIGPVYVPGDPLVVSANSPGNDEDPALLAGRDGAIYLAWYSHAYGDHIVISRTDDGVHWTAPVRITSGAAVDYGPSLYQDQAGVFHVAFFRWETGAPPGKIVHARSIDQDGLSWDGTSSNDVTDANATDDWVPSLAANADGDLVVAFARNTCPPPSTCYAIETATSRAAGASWDAPVAVVSAGAGEQHHLPAIALDHGELAIAWVPYASTASAPWADVQSGAHVSLLRGGTTTAITTAQPTSVTLFPTFYAVG
ncbi:MAG TPA: hypothetical protein VL463_17870, partial [Kofleriaceae bacterium]|nr:hypothetical protein [Kofleriaceae bacterium]